MRGTEVWLKVGPCHFPQVFTPVTYFTVLYFGVEHVAWTALKRNIPEPIVTTLRGLKRAVKQSRRDVTQVALRGRELCACLERPTAHSISSTLLEIQGWAFFIDDEKSYNLVLSIDGIDWDVSFVSSDRVDVTESFPNCSIQKPGFLACVPLGSLAPGPHTIEVHAEIDAKRYRVGSSCITVESSPYPEYTRQLFTGYALPQKKQRLDKIYPFLRCPACRENKFHRSEMALICTCCDNSYVLHKGVPVMQSNKLKFPLDADSFDSPISNNPYADLILQRLEPVLSEGGLILEVGAGRKLYGMEQIVQLEISGYPYTDVINQSEILPFSDAVFDCVFSLAVTEHVNRPWILAEEMQRVLKPGGLLIADSAFMQPLHGFPSHFFNMTGEGLREIFSGLEVTSLQPESHQHPWISTEAFLRYLLTKTPPATRAAIIEMSVGDLWHETQKNLLGQSELLSKLSIGEELVTELAAGYTLIGRKPK